ncbi:MAG TPA: M28 family peptidase [Thermoanaerobaculia bacterium]|nr:M28 family peptidase [Thermoanaerobaculia bacterium]
MVSRMLTAILLPLLLLALFARTRGESRNRGRTVDPARLEAHVRALAEDFIPRDEDHPENLDQAAAYIRRQLEQAGGRVEDQAFDVAGNTYRNVIARFGPETRERIVVGAHYDAAGPYPGADDNASGVAGLIELAFLLGKGGLPLQVELVAYTLEEPPYFASGAMGSAVHAASLKKQGIPVRAMISLEMIGYFTDAPGSQELPAPFLKLLYPSKGNFIAVVGKLGQGSLVGKVKKAMKRAAPLPVESINAPTSLPGVDLSDHRNYWAAGYPAVMLTDTAFFRNPHYHGESDTPDTLDYRRMALVVEGVYGAVKALAR